MCPSHLPHDARHLPSTTLKFGLGPHLHSWLEVQYCDHGQLPEQVPPQSSAAPHLAPAQLGVQHVPALHTMPEAHVHVMLAPQPSDTEPHRLPHPCGAQPHALGTPPPPQVSGAVHPPHCSAPHACCTVPHCAPWLSHDGSGQPHWFGVPPPPQLMGAVHAPQSSTAAQPSDTNPHVPGIPAHVAG
jgi:hypothetical protein